MRAPARFHPDHRRRQLGAEPFHLAAPQLPADHHPTRFIDPCI
jgi:hypothetical protein